MSNLESRLEKLERHLRGIDEEVNTISSMVSSQSEPSSDDDRGAANPDEIWCCRKCGSRLGFYDPESDLLRIRYKDFVTYIHIGVGGFVQVLCRSCSEMNTAEYESKDKEIPSTPELIKQIV
jgi:hypothetical protein